MAIGFYHKVLIHRIANDLLHFVEHHRSLLCEKMSKCFIKIEKPRLIDNVEIIKIFTPSVDNKLSTDIVLERKVRGSRYGKILNAIAGDLNTIDKTINMLNL